jgi:hypothetical protein
MGTCNDPYARILRAAGAAIEVIAVAMSARIHRGHDDPMGA